MHIFLTGATGFVGKHLLYYLLKTTDVNITIPIRDKKGNTSSERFEKEIIQSELFKQCDTSRVKSINKDINTIDLDDLSGVNCFVHCAAVVKFNQPLDILLKDNYESVKRLYNLCNSIKFVYVSTCYTHPKYLNEPGKAEKIEKLLPKEAFICDYAYTKYLAEQYLCENTTSQIDIVRLSCVGAPLELLPPMRGPAHLGILELGYRKTISDIWFPDNFQFSVVPVDVVCKNLIQVIQTSHEGIVIKQFAAPSDSDTYNISAVELAKPILNENNITYWDCSYKLFVTMMSIIYFFIPSLLEKILDTNYIISSVSSNIVFESSIELPSLSKESYLNLTRNYVRRLVEENPKKTNPWFEIFYSFLLLIKNWLVKFFYASRDKLN